VNLALATFDGIANFGSTTDIARARSKVQDHVVKSMEFYSSLNASRNPLNGFEMYVSTHYGLGLDLALVVLVRPKVVTHPYSFVASHGSALAVMIRYILPVLVAVSSIVLQWFTDFTCSPYSTICRAASETLSHIYAVVISFMVIIGITKYQQIHAAVAPFIALLLGTTKMKTSGSPKSKSE
jgi:hypothetical protein